jgi:hypothetical protein
MVVALDVRYASRTRRCTGPMLDPRLPIVTLPKSSTPTRVRVGRAWRVAAWLGVVLGVLDVAWTYFWASAFSDGVTTDGVYPVWTASRAALARRFDLEALAFAAALVVVAIALEIASRRGRLRGAVFVVLCWGMALLGHYGIRARKHSYWSAVDALGPASGYIDAHGSHVRPAIGPRESAR